MDSLAIEAVEAIIGHHFSQPQLLREALTHPSCNEKDEAGYPLSYQRLEFLGDSVLGAVISSLLYTHFPDENEGRLAQRKAVLVSGKVVASVVRELGLHQYIRFSATEAASGGADSRSVQEDIGEALLGALLQDGGFDAAHRFVEKHWLARLIKLQEAPKDAKTALQEAAQGQGLPLPEYVMIGQEGEAHAPLFTIEVRVKGLPPQRAEAGNKRKAEQLAAAQMLAAEFAG